MIIISLKFLESCHFSTAMHKMMCSIAAVQFGFGKDEYTFLMTHIYLVNF